jgi:Tol biopolymer transport system component
VRTIAVLLAIIGTLAATGGAAEAAYPGASGRIAFQRLDGYVYSIKPDGTGLLKLAQGYSPAYSPDGTRIAFVRAGDIWTMNADGSNQQQVTASTFDESSPTWSPDGSMLAFGSFRDSGGIYSLRSTRPYGTLRLIVKTPNPAGSPPQISDEGPSWGVNGLIYFTRHALDRSTCGQSYTMMRVNPGTGATQIIEPNALQPDLGPSGRSVTYMHWSPDDACTVYTGISLAAADGTNPRVVTALRPGTPYDSNPVFSPDGTRIAFQRGNGTYIVRPNGAGLHRLTAGQAPTWQPVG